MAADEGSHLQMLITGMLLGAMTNQQALDITVEPAVDDRGNWQPHFYVTGNQSGNKIRVSVETVEKGEDDG